MTLVSLKRSLFGTIIFLAPMSVTQWNKPLLVVILMLSLLLLGVIWGSDKGIRFSRLSLTVLFWYLSIFVVGFISLLVGVTDIFGILVNVDTLGRLFTIFTLLITLSAGFSYIDSADKTEIVKLAPLWLLPGAVFLFFGLYQIYCNATGQPFIIETRDWMHGVPMAIRDAIPKRVTSIAEEPSFYCPCIGRNLFNCGFFTATSMVALPDARCSRNIIDYDIFRGSICEYVPDGVMCFDFVFLALCIG